MTDKEIKELLCALITIAALMVYVEIRIGHFKVQDKQYALTGVMELEDKGKPVYLPVYKEIK